MFNFCSQELMSEREISWKQLICSAGAPSGRGGNTASELKDESGLVVSLVAMS